MTEPVKDMFDNIAPWYDFLNRLLSLRRDVYWRKFTADRIFIGHTFRVLDVACGTGDIALQILRSQTTVRQVVGVDFSPNMLLRTKLKTPGSTKKPPPDEYKPGLPLPNPLARLSTNEISHLSQKIHLVSADALYLPFEDASFDDSIMAFGIRNISLRKQALEEMARVLVPGGQVMILEFATPETRLFKKIYLLYLNRILPYIGGFFSKNKTAYRYLSDTIMGFPDLKKFSQLMVEAGLKQVTYHKLTFGIVNLHIGIKV